MGKKVGLECGVGLRPAIFRWWGRPHEKVVSEQRLEEVKDFPLGSSGEAGFQAARTASAKAPASRADVQWRVDHGVPG